jgi:hypothetical protein
LPLLSLNKPVQLRASASCCPSPLSSEIFRQRIILAVRRGFGRYIFIYSAVMGKPSVRLKLQGIDYGILARAHKGRLGRRDVLAAASALAQPGDTAMAEKQGGELDKTYPVDTVVQKTFR